MSAITSAASILLARDPDSHEVYAVRRSEKLKFFGGFHAFPGGKFHASDSDRKAIPFEANSQTPGPLLDRMVAAARELFEEAGILLARRPDGSFPPSGPELDELRKQLMAEAIPFAQVLTRLGTALHTADFTHLGNLVTPPFTPIRFDTAFFLATAPANQEPQVWPGELDLGQWTTADALLSCWERGECLVSPPSIMILSAIRGRPATDAPALLAPHIRAMMDGAIHPIFFAPDVQLIPLRTNSLPPSSYTNAYLVGRDPVYLFDPGTPFPEEQERLFAMLDGHLASGKPLTAIVLTHRHTDHIGAVNACVARYRLPVYAHAWTAKALEHKIAVQRILDDGAWLDLGKAADGYGNWCLQAIHTPGHDPGHLAFYDPHYRLLFVGDMVSTLSSVVIAPPEGDLAVYLESLRRLQRYDARLLFPGHGPVSNRVRHVLDEAIAHRVKREEQLVEAVASGFHTVPELAVRLYQGLLPELVKFARLQVLAGLAKLQQEGRATVDGEGDEARWEMRPA